MPLPGGFVGKLGGGEGGGVEWVCGVHGAVGGSVSVHSVSVAQGSLLRYAATRSPVLSERMLLPGARAHVTSSSTVLPSLAIILRACYAVSGTHLAWYTMACAVLRQRMTCTVL
eukprot:3766002-Rhodomonas_salina.1